MNVKRQIFEFIVDHQTRWSTLPTQAEVRDAFCGLSDDVDLHLRQLDREGLITIGEAEDASINLPPALDFPTQINFRGRTSSSDSMMLNLRGLHVHTPSDGLEAMQICDESMIDAGIEQGDIVILACAAPVRGDIVAVTLNGIETLRRYIVISGIPHLLAENPRHPDLRAAFDIPMHGVMWGLIRMGPCRHHPKSIQKRTRYSRSAKNVRNGDCASRLDMQSDKDSRSIPTRLSLEARRGRQRSKKRTQRIQRSPKKIITPQNWPEPPSGITLNDGQAMVYGVQNQSVS